MRSHGGALLMLLVLFDGNASGARLEHAVVREQAAGTLAVRVSRAAGNAGSRWVAWEVPAADPDSRMCCFDSVVKGEATSWRGGRCSLVHEGSFFNSNGHDEPAPLEHRSGLFSIYMHVEDGVPVSLRMYSDGCTIDAGGAEVAHLDGVKAEESVGYLATLVGTLRGRATKRGKWSDGGNEVIAAIAMHRAANALPTLESYVDDTTATRELRAHAAFWIGMRGGDGALAFLRGAINRDDSEEFVNQALAGVAQQPSRAALDFLLDLARHHRSPEVRKHAIFWLGQKAGEKVTAELREATDDADDDVKEMAVFAISQLPKDRSVPELIQLVKTHKSRAVREKALFWLGQSGDPRALDLIEQILTK